MFVPLTHDGFKGWIFDLVCSGNAMSVSIERLLLLKSATVNWNLSFDDVCKEKQVNIAYNNDPPYFEIDKVTGEMVKYPTYFLGHGNIPWEWELQAAFFKYNNIKAKWFNCNYIALAINHTPHFDVWSALAPTLNFGGVWITTPHSHPHCIYFQKQKFFKNHFYKNLFLQFLY